MRYLFGLALALCTTSPAWAEEWDFVLINDTSRTLADVEIAPTGSTDWKPGLGSAEERKNALIKPKARTTVRFDRASNQCRFDLRATFEDKATQVFTNANICDNSYITLKLVGEKASISAN